MPLNLPALEAGVKLLDLLGLAWEPEIRRPNEDSGTLELEAPNQDVEINTDGTTQYVPAAYFIAACVRLARVEQLRLTNQN